MTSSEIKRQIAPGLADIEVRAIRNYAVDADWTEARRAAKDLVKRYKPVTTQTLANWREVGERLDDFGWTRTPATPERKR